MTRCLILCQCLGVTSPFNDENVLLQQIHCVALPARTKGNVRDLMSKEKETSSDPGDILFCSLQFVR